MADAERRQRLQEFNESAERHWQAIAADGAGRAHALNKPAGAIHETAALMFRLGLVLSELRAGLGHTVLDFAAGSCWLSALLNRMGCRTVSVDISPTALALGRELFALDPRQRPELEPRFLTYDGHHLPLEDASVDRIVCFDAFHHVPNPEEILREFHRVLKTGGRAVFAEPGEDHAQMPRSVFEAQRYGILESDLHLEEVLALAQAAGFDQAGVKPYADADLLTFDAGQFRDFMSGHDGTYPLHIVRESLRHFCVFRLQKGSAPLDSRSPGSLRADIAPAGGTQAFVGTEGTVVPCSFRIRNTGDTSWLRGPDPVGGFVALGAHLLDGEGAVQVSGVARGGLPDDVPPGASVDVTLEVALPLRVGLYGLRVDMVDEHVAWFAQLGSPTLDVPLLVLADDGVPDSRRPGRLAAEMVLVSPPPSPWAVAPGARLSLRLRVTNAGDTRWLPITGGVVGTVAVGGRLWSEGGSGPMDYLRAHLPEVVAPGAAVEVSASFDAPARPGRHRLELDMVDEGITWFGAVGSSILSLDLVVA